VWRVRSWRRSRTKVNLRSAPARDYDRPAARDGARALLTQAVEAEVFRRSGAHPLHADNPAALRPAFEEPALLSRRTQGLAELAQGGIDVAGGHERQDAPVGVYKQMIMSRPASSICS
jgi:hypothetical protein